MQIVVRYGDNILIIIDVPGLLEDTITGLQTSTKERFALILDIWQASSRSQF